MDILSAVIPKSLCVTGLSLEYDNITIHAQSHSAMARCPICKQLSSRIHSRYSRSLADLPWAGLPVCFRVSVRRFYCANDFCPRKLFAERLHGVAKEYARRTNRHRAALEEIAFALGGEAGSRLAAQLGFFISPDTLLRYIRDAPDPEVLAITVLGVDDWAWRRRLRYGTILVDLERHRVIDLLPDRSSASFADWLMDHREVRIISRDRGGEYREGASRGAPSAVQVADRFHLIKNFSEAIQKVFMRHIALLSRVPAPGSPRMLSPPRPYREASRERTRRRMAERYETVRSMANKNMSTSAIARALELNRQTVGKYLRSAAVPERPKRKGTSSALTPYEGYVLERCKQGYWNAVGLWREIVALGYPGEYKTVSRLVTYLRKMAGDGMVAPGRNESMTPRSTVGLLLRHPEDRSASQWSTIEALAGLDPEIKRTIHLFEWFARLVRRQCDENLDDWLSHADESGIDEIKRFVTKLRQDLDAIVAGMNLPWSQGQTEGQVTRLKLIRRQMYGRGNFDLLRKRVLRAA